MNTATIRLFQRAVHLWLLGYLVSAVPAGEWLWSHPVSPQLPVSGALGLLTDPFGTWLPGEVAMPAVLLLLTLAAYGLWREPPVWMAFLTWMLFSGLAQRAWLAGSGGLQLMANVLLWMVPLRAAPTGRIAVASSWLAFHAIRVQLAFTYLITGLHKLTGTSWTDGTAVGSVASDPLYGPAFLAAWPALSAVLTWSWLVFQFAFPLLVWWRPARTPLLVAGALFHLCTAWWVGIPEMGLAFIACYAIWWEPGEARSAGAMGASG